VPNTEQVTLRISGKMLYVGNTTAYPLSSVVRVQWGRYNPRTDWAVKSILLNLTVFGPLIVLANHFTGLSSLFAGTAGFVGLIEFALVGGCAIRCLEPVRILWEARNPYYTLSIDTAGSVGTRLGNPDWEILAKVARMIVDAIDDPAADWLVSVVNYHLGDNISQSGPGSVAKVTA
jgi:Family of unknown function (DUF6232)